MKSCLKRGLPEDYTFKFMGTRLDPDRYGIKISKPIGAFMCFFGSLFGFYILSDFLAMMMGIIRRLGEGSVLWTDTDARRDSFATVCSMHVQILQFYRKASSKRVQFVTETADVVAQGLPTDEWQRHKPIDTKSDPSIYGVQISSRQTEISSLDVLQLTNLATKLFSQWEP